MIVMFVVVKGLMVVGWWIVRILWVMLGVEMFLLLGVLLLFLVLVGVLNVCLFVCFRGFLFCCVERSECVRRSKGSVEGSVGEGELIANLSDFVKNKVDLSCIDESEGLMIPEDNGATVAFASANIQKNNEETNSNASTINLGKCEDILKNVYNISNESNLYILKIDKE